MTRFNERFIVDGYGNRVGVLLDMQEYRKIMDDLEEYRKIMDDLEELDSIRAYDAAKASGDEAIPFDEAVGDIEQNRQ